MTVKFAEGPITAAKTPEEFQEIRKENLKLTGREANFPPLRKLFSLGGGSRPIHPYTGWPIVTEWVCKVCVKVNKGGDRCEKCGRKRIL